MSILSSSNLDTSTCLSLFNFFSLSKLSPRPFKEASKVAIFIPETGEIILSNDAHNTLRIKEAKIEVEYSKNVFEAGDVRPEHYYTCTSTDKDTNKPIIYTYEKVAENDFSILYNSVPIGKNDETYT